MPPKVQKIENYAPIHHSKASSDIDSKSDKHQDYDAEDIGSITTPEGARLRDICQIGFSCNDDRCIRYHPKWMFKVCYKNFIGECRYGPRCHMTHRSWRDQILTIKNDQTVDHFTNQPFRKVQMFKIIPPTRGRGGPRGPKKDFEHERTLYLQDLKSGKNRQTDGKATMLEIVQNKENQSTNQQPQFMNAEE